VYLLYVIHLKFSFMHAISASVYEFVLCFLSCTHGVGSNRDDPNLKCYCWLSWAHFLPLNDMASPVVTTVHEVLDNGTNYLAVVTIPTPGTGTCLIVGLTSSFLERACPAPCLPTTWMSCPHAAVSTTSPPSWSLPGTPPVT